jgi:tetratricopeptide (TPR) repeat protein
LNPDAYLWQAGIVKYYLNEWSDAAAIFAKSAELFETKFQQPASEERIWRDACALKYASALPSKKQRNKLLESIDDIIPTIQDMVINDEEDEFMAFARKENRKVIQYTRDLLQAALRGDRTQMVLAKAQLASLSGNKNDKSNISDKKMRKLTSLFYLGLFHDAMGEETEAKACLKRALHLSPSSGKSSDIMQTLPLLHMTARDWFDDDLFDGDDDEDLMRVGGEWNAQLDHNEVHGDGDADDTSSSTNLFLSGSYSDPLLEQSIKEDVDKMSFSQLRESLKIRGLATTGSKQVLRDRLFYSLMDDAGYQSGFAP